MDVPSVFFRQLLQPHIGTLCDQHDIGHPGLIGTECFVLLQRRLVIGGVAAARSAEFLIETDELIPHEASRAPEGENAARWQYLLPAGHRSPGAAGGGLHPDTSTISRECSRAVQRANPERQASARAAHRTGFPLPGPGADAFPGNPAEQRLHPYRPFAAAGLCPRTIRETRQRPDSGWRATAASALQARLRGSAVRRLCPSAIPLRSVCLDT